MAPAYTQDTRPIRLTTPLGPNKLLVTAFEGSEAISQLYRFSIQMLAPFADGEIAFEKLLGQPANIVIETVDGKPCFFHGIISRFSQGVRGAEFDTYRAELVPLAWMLTRVERSRIFQHINVPDILEKVFKGLDFKLSLQKQYEPRDYCVQYRESDWSFASRLMEEEGIYYYFAHAEAGAVLTLADTPKGHPKIADPEELAYDTTTSTGIEDRIWKWEKVQEVVSGKVTLWDHCFELPGKNLETIEKVQKSVAIGKVTHDLTAGKAETLEVYDYPGAFAGRFDGIDTGGGEAASELSKIFDDSKRTTELRMQESAVRAIRIHGAGDCARFSAGHTFDLKEHFDADGTYVITRVEHIASLENFRSGGTPFQYDNRFECIPAALPFRPQRTTVKPTVRGAQTATVVGPAGDEIFTDKYSRVKVQFHWDREGKNDSESSCWIRVATPWAGQNWGIIHIPRIGQEVVVDFLEGDPDQPIIVGSVYNAEQMPPWKLPDNQTQSGILSRSTLKGTAANANAIRFEDKKGKEQVWIHAEKNQDIEVENDETHWVGHDRTKTIDHDETTHVKHDRTETVDNNETITIHGNRTETVDKDETITIHKNRTEKVDLDETITIGKNRTETVTLNETLTVGQSQSLTIGMNQTTVISVAHSITVGAGQALTIGAAQAITVGGGQAITVGEDITETAGGGYSQTVAKDSTTKVGGARSTDVGKDDSLKVAKKLVIDAGEEIIIKTGDASITMKKDGTIAIKGKDILIQGSGKITAKADSDMVLKGSKIGAN